MVEAAIIAIWKIWVNMGIFHTIFGVNITIFWNHHPVSIGLPKTNEKPRDDLPIWAKLLEENPKNPKPECFGHFFGGWNLKKSPHLGVTVRLRSVYFCRMLEETLIFFPSISNSKFSLPEKLTWKPTNSQTFKRKIYIDSKPPWLWKLRC